MTTEQEGRYKVKFDLVRLRKRLELQEGRNYTWDEIADGAGLHINTVYGLANNNSKRVDVRTMEKLINYFKREGLDVGPGDLFALEPTAEAA